MTLIEKARKETSLTPRERTVRPMTNEEIDLYLAYMEGRVAQGQVIKALGRSYGYGVNWLRRCTEYLYHLGLVTISIKNMKYNSKNPLKD